MTIKPLLRAKEYAEIRGCSTRTEQRERETGIGCPYIAIGRSIRYRPEDVEKFIISKLQRKIPTATSRCDGADGAATKEQSPHQEEGVGRDGEQIFSSSTNSAKAGS